MGNFILWGETLPSELFTPQESEYLGRFVKTQRPTCQMLWQELNRVWKELSLDQNRSLSGQNISGFYSHPVWILNGIFSMIDPESASHREAIARGIAELGSQIIADYGGGFGSLAKAIRGQLPYARIDIVEPYPSKIGAEFVSRVDSLTFTKKLDGPYDCIVAQDVLEHLEDPISLALELTQATRTGGYLIFANNFYPVIDCHLPGTFYLRHLFPFVVRGLGLRLVGRVSGAPHAMVFCRDGAICSWQLKLRDQLAHWIGPGVNQVRDVGGRLKARLSCVRAPVS